MVFTFFVFKYSGPCASSSCVTVGQSVSELASYLSARFSCQSLRQGDQQASTESGHPLCVWEEEEEEEEGVKNNKKRTRFQHC